MCEDPVKTENRTRNVVFGSPVGSHFRIVGSTIEPSE